MKQFCTDLVTTLFETPYYLPESHQLIIQAARNFLVWGKDSEAIPIQSLARGYILRKNLCRICGKIPKKCDNVICTNKVCCVSETNGYNLTQYNGFVLCNRCLIEHYCECCKCGCISDEHYDCEMCNDTFCWDCRPHNEPWWDPGYFYTNLSWDDFQVCPDCTNADSGYFICYICGTFGDGDARYTCEVCAEVFCTLCLTSRWDGYDGIWPICENCEVDIDSDDDGVTATEIEMWGNMQRREQQYKGAYVLQHNEHRKTAKLLPKFFDHKINQFLEGPEPCFICVRGSPYMTHMFNKDWNPGSSKAMIKPCKCDRKCHVVCFYQWRRYGNADYSPDQKCPECQEFYEPNLLFLMGDKEKESTKPRGDPWHAYRADIAASKVSDIVAYRQWQKQFREEQFQGAYTFEQGGLGLPRLPRDMTGQITSFTSPPGPVPTHSRILRNDRAILREQGLEPTYEGPTSRISLQRNSRQEPMHMGGESKNRSSSPTQSYPEPSDSDEELDENLVGYYKIWNGTEWLLRRHSPFDREKDKLERELATLTRARENLDYDQFQRLCIEKYNFCTFKPSNEMPFGSHNSYVFEQECRFRVRAYCSRCQKPNPDFTEMQKRFQELHHPRFEPKTFPEIADDFQEFNRFGPRDTESWHIVCNECLKKPFNYKEWKKGRWKYVPLK